MKRAFDYRQNLQISNNGKCFM